MKMILTNRGTDRIIFDDSDPVAAQEKFESFVDTASAFAEVKRLTNNVLQVSMNFTFSVYRLVE